MKTDNRKRAKNGKRTPTDKQIAFAKEYAVGDKASRLNATQSAVNVYPPKERRVAQVIGSENLAKPIVIKLIDEHLTKAGLTDKSVTEVHHRNMVQSKMLSVSQQAVRDYYTLKGHTADSVKSDTKIAFIINIDK